ncbi:class I SAM-dependent methyltransferase [Desulfallas thermosapovorans]|uniref:SAM-dependent MidA family methyltransferase n=1 Tax=Desulfallas thermosapovorans DSM 6562 TaxID=1121431 RepID=A0A5S4ZPZ5_9FIRM|nr:SAM-dependent methyltransferase [Desulfallas thermosapovorans]TYO94972.1 SAM-dependent MidA family methyltransferase [Desulfallas thermosapovorans DSM 6562]
MPVLAGIIKQEIETNGPITFARFMEQALYHPELGYYTSPGQKIGRRGDFYTAPTINPLFAAMLARRIEQMWVATGRPKRWVVVEYGPGTGILARDILAAMKQHHPGLFNALEYYLIEISSKLIETQQRVIGYTPVANNNSPTGHNQAGTSGHVYSEKIHWVKNLKEIDPGYIDCGCILANELVDAFPIHLVRQNNNNLQELYVSLNSDNLCDDNEGRKHDRSMLNITTGLNKSLPGIFTLIPGPLSTRELADYFDIQNIQLENGQRAEVNLQAHRWLAEIAAHLKKGYLLIIDYGTTSRELYSTHRYNGTLRCFHKHRLVDNPLINIGGQDITAHVNFSTLITWGEQLGLHKIEYTTQPQFLLNMGILDTLQKQPDYTMSPELVKITSAIKQLVLPGGMGGIFKVLILGKNLSGINCI